MDAFISHSSQDVELAERFEIYLQEHGLDVWLDRSDIRLGSLLRNELQKAIQDSRVLILLSSKSAQASLWVAAELLTAFHHDRFIIPCVLDGVTLPYFLKNSIYLDMRREKTNWMRPLLRTVLEAPNSSNEVPPTMSRQSAELKQVIQEIYNGQRQVLERLQYENLHGAQEAQRYIDEVVLSAEKRWPLESMVLNLAGYHRKNAYMLKHWDAIQAGRPPKDPLLQHAQRVFFDALFGNPNDYSALTGLGSVLLFERDLDAAEFFIRRAISLAEDAGVDYPDAKHDLAMILSYRTRDTRL